MKQLITCIHVAVHAQHCGSAHLALNKVTSLVIISSVLTLVTGFFFAPFASFCK